MFGQKNFSYLGVDLGSSSIKVVELANFKHQPRLATYGFTEKSIDKVGSADILANADEAALILKDIVKKAKATTAKAVAALPNHSVFVSVLTLPALKPKELASAIRWEAKKIIPLKPEEVELDWKIIEEFETAQETEKLSAETMQETGAAKKIFSKPQKNYRVLVTGANKSLIKKYVDIFNKAGLSLLSLETESFALVRSLLGNDKSVAMIIDLGAITTSFTVAESAIPVMTRSIEVGGLATTKSIAMALNVSLDRAEQFKQDLSTERAPQDAALPKTIEQSFAPILNEIKFTIKSYGDTYHKNIEKIVLTGGMAMTAQLAPWLSEVLKINVEIGDPFASIVYPVELRPVLDRIGSKLSVAVGLAMREIE